MRKKSMLIITLLIGVIIIDVLLTSSVSKDTSPNVQGSQPIIVPVSTPDLGNTDVAIGYETPSISEKIEAVQTFKSRVENTSIPYETYYEYDSSLIESETYVRIEGVEGIQETSFSDEYVDDKYVASTFVSESVVSEPIHEVIVIGTKVEAAPIIEEPKESENQERAVTQGSFDDGLARSMFDALNDVRSKNGLGRIQWSNQLFEYAKVRAQETSVVFDHLRPDGSSWDSLNPDVIYAENLATKAYKVNVAMDALMNSPTHKKNILSDFPKGSVAVFRASDGEIYWVQLFGY